MTQGPDTIESHLDKASQFYQAGRLGEAQSHYKRVLQLNPAQPEALRMAGQIAYHMRQHDLAIALLGQASQVDGQNAEVWLNLGVALGEAGHEEKAGKAFEKAVTCNPSLLEACLYLGSHYAITGQTKKAEEAYKKAISLYPQKGEAYRLLAFLKRAPDDAKTLLQDAEKVLKHIDANSEDAMHLYYALGQLHDLLDNRAEAFSYLQKANALQHRSAQPNIQSYTQYFKAIRKYHKDTDHTPKAGANSHPRPVFIVGLPRSGTTLVEQVLASHSQVTAGDELTYLKGDILPAIKALTGQPYPQALPYLSDEQKEKLGDLYLNRLRSRDHKAQVMTDKNPGNFHVLGLIPLILPDARIIYVTRNPMAVGWSMMKNWFPGPAPFQTSFDDLAVYMKLTQEHMAFWQKKMPNQILTVSYEKLVSDFEKEARQILAHTNLTFEENCLRPDKTERNVRTNSAIEARQKVTTSRIENWRRYEEQLQPLKEALIREGIKVS